MQLHPFCIFALISIVITNSVNSQCSTLLNNSKSSVLDFEDCGKLGKVFESTLLYQFFQLDRVFNPPSKIYPLIVKVYYSIDLTMHDPDSGCSKFNWPNTTEVLVLHWTSKSLYKNFGSTVINQIPLQAPYKKFFII